ncbi:MAG: F0F1 ATP synthase subunit delta [Bacteriovoracaceae bacterium]
MKEAQISRSYAKAMIELAEKDNVDVYGELLKVHELINGSNELENVLFLEVFTLEEKEAVLKDVLSKLGSNKLVTNFLLFLLSEKRIGLFPQIFKEIVVLDDHKKGFLRGTIEGSDKEIAADTQAKLKSYIAGKLGTEPELTYVQSDKISAGYRVTVEDLQLDATIDHQLNELKGTILNS